MSQLPRLAALVLAGGAGRRMGGAAKPARTVGGVRLLDRVLAAVDGAGPRIVVGPPDLGAGLPPDVILTREQPPGGGPVSAIAAGLARLAEIGGLAGSGPPGRPVPELVALLAADLPFLTGEVIGSLVTLVAGRTDIDGAVLSDDRGRPQWLAGVWRVAALSARLAALGPLQGLSMRSLTAGLAVSAVPAAADPRREPAWFDCDTEAALQQADEWARRRAHGDFG